MIGIGITTRNRPDVLEWTLKHFTEYQPKSLADYVIVDDNSTNDNAIKNKEIASTFNIKYVYNEERNGVAKTKNKCASLLNTEYIFLFDDDTYPRRSGWDFPFINTHKKTGIQHLCYIREVDHIKRIYKDNLIEIFRDCLGSCCFFTKKCFDVLGGFDEEYGLFGFEHADISQRAYSNGFVGKTLGYYSPANCQKYIYGLDTDYKSLCELTNLGVPSFEFNSSTHNEPVKEYINNAGLIFQKKRIF